MKLREEIVVFLSNTFSKPSHISVLNQDRIVSDGSFVRKSTMSHNTWHRPNSLCYHAFLLTSSLMLQEIPDAKVFTLSIVFIRYIFMYIVNRHKEFMCIFNVSLHVLIFRQEDRKEKCRLCISPLATKPILMRPHWTHRKRSFWCCVRCKERSQIPCKITGQGRRALQMLSTTLDERQTCTGRPWL